MLDCDLSPQLELGYFDPYELMGEVRSRRDILVVCENPEELSRRLVEFSDVWTRVRHAPLAHLEYPHGGTAYFIEEMAGYRGGADTVYLLGVQSPETMDQLMLHKSSNPWMMIRRLKP
jgi:hypothetical protein